MFDIEAVSDKTRSVYGRIADAICEAVASGRMAEGERLPTETALAASMGVSRLTVSRAYRDLKAKGIVTQRRRGGTRVAPDAARLAIPVPGRPVRTIAVILGARSISECSQDSRFIVSALLDGIRDVLGERGPVIRCLTTLTPQDAAALTHDDALLLFVAPDTLDVELLASLLRRGVRIASVWATLSPLFFPSIHYDRRHAATLACKRLIDSGYKRIGFLGLTTDGRGDAALKYAAYMSSLHQAGLDTCACHVRHAAPLPGAAYVAARQIIDAGDLPEAFFVDTDYKAMEAIHALKTAGIRVPQDIGIVSYDDIPEAATFDPPLTTVRTPRRDIGRRTAQLLLGWPKGGPAPKSILLSSELIVRSSTRPWPT